MVGAGSKGKPEFANTEPCVNCAGESICAAAIGGVKTVKVSAFDVPPPPPAVRVKTVTGMEAAVATSVAGMAAFNPVELLNVVGTAVPFHWTTEQGDSVPPFEPLPSTPSVNAGDPAAALEGRSVVITGVGSGVVDAAMVKAAAAEAREGMVTLDTVMFAGPGKAVSTAEIAAVSWVALTKVVARGEPFQFTVRPLGTKFVPLTVSVMPASLQAGVEFDVVEEAESDVMVGRAIGKAMALETVALPAGLATET